MSTDTLTPPNTNASDDIVIDVQADSLTGTGVRTAEAYRSLAESLSQSVMRVHVKVCRWRGHIQLQGATVEFNGVRLSAADGVKAQPYPLLPDTWKRRFTTLENTLRSAVRRRCIQIYAYNLSAMNVPDVDTDLEEDGIDEQHALISSDNIIATSSKNELRQELNELVRDRWNPLVDEFVAAYPTILEERKSSVNAAIREAIEQHAPSQAAVRSCFKVIYMPLPLGIRADDLTIETLQDGAGDYLVALRESLIRQTLGNLRAASENLMTKINNKSVVRGGTVEAVGRAITRLRSFAGALDVADLDSQLIAAERLLQSADPREINQSSRNGVGDIATRINEALLGIVRETDSSVPGGRGIRRVGL